MTARLENVLRQLTDEEIERITRDAESILADRKSRASAAPSGWKLDCVGAMRDAPERSGLEAQATAMREWEESLEKKRQDDLSARRESLA